MERANVTQIELRYGDHGPGYIAKGPRTDVGYVVLPPGKDFPNHYHERIEEGFYTIAGSVTLWVGCRERLELRAGDYVRCDPYEMHYFVNEGTEVWRALFVKAPHVPGDGIVVDWRPGEPVPEVPRRDGA
jgi:mannose-6-phosphate isomerase-like protein (cupin superfamily)